MKFFKKLLLVSVLTMIGATSLWANSYRVVTELPSKIFIKSVGSHTSMEAKGNEIKLHTLNTNNRNQQWYAFKSGSDGEYRLRNAGAGKYLNIETIKTGKLIKKNHKILGLNSRYTKVKFLALNDTSFLIKVSGNEVADAQGGAKAYQQGQAVIPYGLNNGAGQKWYIYYEEGGRIKMFHLTNYAREKQSASNGRTNGGDQPVNNGGSSNTLSQSLNNVAIAPYMHRANAGQFRSENSGNILSEYINKQDEVGRLNFIEKVISSACNNSDNSFRTAVYNELNKANITSNGFAARLLKGQLKKNILKYQQKEKYYPAKAALGNLSKKYN